MSPAAPAPITIAILAGGASRRMGRDKAALVLDGRTLLQRAIDTALSVSPRVLVVGGANGSAAFGEEVSVSATTKRGDGPHFLADTLAGQGPLGGLATALGRAASPVLLLACDMPLLTAGALAWLVHEATHPTVVDAGALAGAIGPDDGLDGTVTRWQGRLEPLFAVYGPACLPMAEAQLAAGVRAMHRFVAGGRFRMVEAPAWVGGQLVNVNTPEEWERLQGRRPA